MEAFGSLSPTNRPVLLDSETLLATQSNVGLYQGKQRDVEHDTGIAYCTSHRIIWIDEQRPKDNSLQLPLDRVSAIEPIQGLFKSSPKLRLMVQARSAVLAPQQSRLASPTSPTLPIVKPAVPSWKCSICSHLNPPTAASKCELCGVPRSASASAELFLACPACTFLNRVVAGTARACEVCGTQLPVVPNAPGRPEPGPPATPAEVSCPACTFVNPASADKCDMCGTKLAKATAAPPPQLVSEGDNSPRRSWSSSSLPAAAPDGPSGATETVEIKLSFRGGGQAAFLDKLRQAMSGRAWEKKLPPTPPAPGSSKSAPLPQKPEPPSAGISGIIRTMDRQQFETTATMDRAFRDLDALMREAGEMVKLAEQISSKLSRDEANSDSKEAIAFRSYLAELGISNPVTRESAGDIFHQELAKQLADFLVPVLTSPTSPGMMSLVDAYTLFNRARGVALISPDDMRRSASLFEKLGLPLRLRTFPKSGLVVVESEDVSEERISERVWSLASSKAKGLTAFGVAGTLGTSVALAGEWLLMTEARGLICRDETVEGLRFHDNLIKFFEMPQDYRVA
ncbi:EAP30/Vps36 family-domain-containing protein [Hyaloraphidium curvatum]|nr:EAP30/Vps36 family-domain-containing protein [Hyaloraphidium curvatum]